MCARVVNAAALVAVIVAGLPAPAMAQRSPAAAAASLGDLSQFTDR